MNEHRVIRARGQPVTAIVLALLLLLLASWPVSAQDTDHVVLPIVKQVLFDPTTYVPAAVAWKAARLDWESSQVFFDNGWLEANPRFTVSGRPNDVAIGYAAGNRRITVDAFKTLSLSAIHNASERTVESLLIPRYPQHRKLVRVVGWIERSAVATYLSYRLSADHWRQWQDNQRRAAEIGYR
jgi:hypothetical protein